MAAPRRPLEGVRALDFGQTMAGPFLGFLLADLGAEVIKVETRKRPDSLRLSPDNLDRDVEKDPWFHSANRNKLGVTVDFTCVEGVALLKRLVAKSDVVVENFSPTVMARHDLHYAALSEVNPAIVMISMPSAGLSGPLADIVTYGPTLTGLVGVDCMIGYEGEKVLGFQQAFADANAAIAGAFAVLAALHRRRRTGRGQHIEMSQLEATAATLGEAFMGYFMNGIVPTTLGNRAEGMAPHNNYRCQGDDDWVSIAVSNDDEWQRFCRAIGDPEWTEDARFADAFSRQKNREALDQHVTEWTLRHSHYEVTAILQTAGVAAMPCLNTAERFVDPHMTAREVYVDFEHPITGVDYICNTPFKMSGTPCGIRLPSPQMGEHNGYVFGELLGMPLEEIAALVERGVLV